ncbi:MAG: hypothetical protein H0T62_00505 [Parachlamydiaceae bacterium]|nr:hypothetical protein [Parachlamydiaceae bacterium]
MTCLTISSLVTIFIFGIVGLSAEVCEQEYTQEQAEYIERAPDQRTCNNPNCQCCRRKCKRKRWRSTRFAEKQYQEAGWPGRRGDELSDQLSR